MTALLSTFYSRSYAGEADFSAIAQLINTCKAADALDDFTSVDELRHEFSGPDFDLNKDLQLWETATGELCACADCWLPSHATAQTGYFFFCVHPAFRGRGLEATIIQWAETRLLEVARDRGQRAYLRSGAQDTQTERLSVLKQHNFIADRFFYRMARSLTLPIPPAQLPTGYTVRPLHATEVAKWVEMFNQTFIDHWNFLPLTVEARQHWMTEAAYVPELDLVAIAPNGTFAAFCYSVIHAQANARTGRQEGWIADLGTRRGFRQQGLGRAMLLMGLHALKAHGMDTALLGVDAENPSGALKLYESAGFQKRHTNISMVKEIGL